MAAGGRPQSSWPLLDTGLSQVGNPDSPTKASKKVDIRLGGFRRLGLKCSEVEQHPFQVSTVQRKTATWQQLYGPRLCTNTQMHVFHSSQWLGSFPTAGAKEWQVNTYGGQKHTKPQLPANTHTHTHTHVYSFIHSRLSFSDTRVHMVQTD